MSKILTAEKNKELMDFSSYWKPFQITKQDNIDYSNLQGQIWPVKNFIQTSVRVRGMLHVKELFTEIWLIGAEIVSKSTNARQILRTIILDENNVLIEDDEQGVNLKLFEDYLCPLLKITNFKEIRVNAMRIRNLAKRGTPTKLTLLVSNQTAGVDGLEKITLTGQNIIRGIQTLKDRQEVDLKVNSIGPWIEVETNELEFTMGKGIFFKDN